MPLRFFLLIPGLLLLLFSVAGAAEWKPDRPVRLVVPWEAGSLSDQLARIVAAETEAAIGEKVLVVNRPGERGAIGAGEAMAARDGHTWLVGAAEHLGTYWLTGELDTRVQDWHVYLMAEVQRVLSVHPNAPYQSFEDFAGAMQGGGTGLVIATGGYYSPGHLAAEDIRRHVGGTYRHSPQRTAKQAISSTVSGESRATIGLIAAHAGLIRARVLRPLAVLSTQPVQIDRYGRVPPITRWLEGFRGASLHIGLFLPGETPEQVVNALDRIWTTAIPESTMLREFAGSKGIVVTTEYRERAQSRIRPSIQITAWHLFDSGSAKLSPETAGILRP